MRRVLIVSPHFPPDSSAATHRVRVLAPHLAAWGWEPTVLTLEPEAYEGGLDPELSLASPVRVVRCRALPAHLTRMVGIGDLGLRSLPGLYRAAARLLQRERFDALYITIFPAYTAMLGPRLSRRFRIPFVLDYQDPWVNAWGLEIGGGADGRVDLKSRASRLLAQWLEPGVVRSASAITAVSEGTYLPILQRNPGIRPITEAIPIGAEPRDFEGELPMDDAGAFSPEDGRVHVVCTGTLAPLGFETLRAVLAATARVRRDHPDLDGRFRVHFVGTSNQSRADAPPRVLSIARELGVDDIVSESPARLPYSEIVRVQRRASVLLVMGSSEPHYTASRIYPFLLAKRPILSVSHEGSSVTSLLRKVARAPTVRLVTYDDARRADAVVGEIAAQLAAFVHTAEWRPQDVDLGALEPYMAGALAGRLAGVLDRAVEATAA